MHILQVALANKENFNLTEFVDETEQENIWWSISPRFQ